MLPSRVIISVKCKKSTTNLHIEVHSILTKTQRLETIHVAIHQEELGHHGLERHDWARQREGKEKRKG
jgi:hypothetical protein